MVKRKVTMPEEDVSSKTFPIVPVGEHRFQVTDVIEGNDPDYVSAKCEVISSVGTGNTLLHRLNLNPNDKFFWLTRLYLKAIGEPCKGEVEIDTDAWIGRQFTGIVKHSTDGKFANIKELVIKEGDVQPIKNANPDSVTEPSEIQWAD